MCVFFFFLKVEVVVWGSFALLPALFQHVESMLCEATAHLGDEENWWSGGLGVTVASHTCKTFFMELVASTNGNHCIHDLKTGVVVQALLLPDQGLWFQELYGAFMSFPCSQHHHSPLQLQKGLCSCSCGAMCTGREDPCWKLDSYPWAVQDSLALCYMSH